jgi:hypothetical protein
MRCVTPLSFLSGPLLNMLFLRLSIILCTDVVYNVNYYCNAKKFPLHEFKLLREILYILYKKKDLLCHMTRDYLELSQFHLSGKPMTHGSNHGIQSTLST